jgi:hypothetical protein
MDLTEIARWLTYYMLGCTLFPDKLDMGQGPTPAELLAMADWADVRAICETCRLLAEEGDTKEVRTEVRRLVVEAAKEVDAEPLTSDTENLGVDMASGPDETAYIEVNSDDGWTHDTQRLD